MSPRLEKGLEELARLMVGVERPWWVIGSSALALSGVPNIEPDDVDVVSDSETLTCLLKHAGIDLTPSVPHARFRSQPYQRLDVPGGTPIELMGDLEVHDGTEFRPLKIQSRQTVVALGREFFIPLAQEQIAILRRFGRSKDLAKAKLLSELL
jgi:hypothetical protein